MEKWRAWKKFQFNLASYYRITKYENRIRISQIKARRYNINIWLKKYFINICNLFYLAIFICSSEQILSQRDQYSKLVSTIVGLKSVTICDDISLELNSNEKVWVSFFFGFSIASFKRMSFTHIYWAYQPT